MILFTALSDLETAGLRQTKQAGRTQVVIDLGLSEPDRTKLTEMGVVLLPLKTRTGKQFPDVVHTLCEYAGTHPGRYAYTDWTTEIPSAIWDAQGFTAQVDPKISLTPTLSPLVRIDDRVKFSTVLEKQIVRHGGLLSPAVLGGSEEDWDVFAVLISTWLLTGFADEVGFPVLAVNLFAAYHPVTVIR